LALFIRRSFHGGECGNGGRLSFELDRAALPDGSVNPELALLIADIKRKSQLELLLFLAIFTCMILMRFGL
jgi:hypothetical protein